MSEELVPLRLLPALERNKILDKWVNGGTIQVLIPQNNKWMDVREGSINYNNYYRLPPAPAITGPWEMLNSKWKWAAMEKDGSVWLYTKKPLKTVAMWRPSTSQLPLTEYILTFREIGDLLDIQVNTDDWEESLTKIRRDRLYPKVKPQLTPPLTDETG